MSAERAPNVLWRLIESRIEALIEWVISRPCVVRWACRNDRRQAGRAAPRFEAASARLTASGAPLDDGAVLRLWQAVKEPSQAWEPAQAWELVDGERFRDDELGREWTYRSGGWEEVLP